MRTGQRDLVYDLHRSLSLCGIGVLHGREEAEIRRAGGDDPRASVHGVARCGSAWACPVCAPRLAARRAEALQPQVGSLLAKGWRARLVTLTVRHTRGDNLGGLLALLVRAWGRVSSGRWWSAQRRVGGVEYVRGVDMTWSREAGWHPHLHLVLLTSPDHGDGAALAEVLLARWIAAVQAEGGEAVGAAQHAVEARDVVATTAYAVTTAAVYEAAASALKTRPAAGSLTPFDLLAAAVGEGAGLPREQAQALWYQYVAATKGRRQVVTSRGLCLSEDALLLDEEEPEAEVVAALDGPALREADRRRMTAGLLETVELAADPARRARVLVTALAALHETGWRVRAGPGWVSGAAVASVLESGGGWGDVDALVSAALAGAGPPS